jgi:hypothetical protein
MARKHISHMTVVPLSCLRLHSDYPLYKNTVRKKDFMYGDSVPTAAVGNDIEKQLYSNLKSYT